MANTDAQRVARSPAAEATTRDLHAFLRLAGALMSQGVGRLTDAEQVALANAEAAGAHLVVVVDCTGGRVVGMVQQQDHEPVELFSLVLGASAAVN